MDLKKNDDRFKLKYSKQAIALLESLDESFDVEAFETWVAKNLFVVGDGYITAYLVAKKNLTHNVIDKITP
jgi:hypothetical protein